MDNDERFELDPDILFRAVGNEGVMVDQREPAVLVINAAALRILELIRGNATKTAITAALAEEFDAAPERIAADVETFLGELKKRKMLQ